MRIVLCGFLQMAFLLGLAQSQGNAGSPRPAGPYPDEQKLLNLVNQEREKAGLPKLQWNDHAAEAAREHSIQMAANLEISHQFPGEPVVSERIANTGMRFTVSAENVAEADSPEEIHMALMHSPGHRANIMSPRYNAVGIGVVLNKGRPMSRRISCGPRRFIRNHNFMRLLFRPSTVPASRRGTLLLTPARIRVSMRRPAPRTEVS
jgi:hypothetical protein